LTVYHDLRHAAMLPGSETERLDHSPGPFVNRVYETGLRWWALTTGNLGGFDAWLADAYAGTLKLETPVVGFGVPMEDIGLKDEVVEAGDCSSGSASSACRPKMGKGR